MKKQKLSLGFLKICLMVLVGGLCFFYYQIINAAFNEPTAAPPGDNVPAPINVGTGAQYKEGYLAVGKNSNPTNAALEAMGGAGRYGIIGQGSTGIVGQTTRDLNAASGVLGFYEEGSNSYYGVYGQAPGVNGVGVRGEGVKYGLSGEARTDGISPAPTAGVYGLSYNGSSSVGVYGYSPTSTGVYGYSITGTGMYGYNDRGTGYGVKGKSGENIGVWGEGAYVSLWGNGGSYSGVYGISTQNLGVYGAGNKGGVYGKALAGGADISNTTHGVYGDAANVSGYAVGVKGASTGYRGVEGLSGTGVGVYGSSSFNYGVYGISELAGVYGQSTGGFGVQGQSDDRAGIYGSSTRSFGVQGKSVNNIAVYGFSNNGNGVYGGSETGDAIQGFSRDKIGVRGESLGNSIVSSGVYGKANASFGGEFRSTGFDGVYGYTDGVNRSGGYFSGPNGNGVYASGGTNGVQARSSNRGVDASGDITGVYGSGGTWGVYGWSEDAYGMYGQTNNGTGVYGTSNAGTGIAGDSINGFGASLSSANNIGTYSYSGSSYGLYGYSNSYIGVAGYSGSYLGVYGNGNLYGVSGYSDTGQAVRGNSPNGYGIYGVSTSGKAGYFEGRVDIIGDLYNNYAVLDTIHGISGVLVVDSNTDFVVQKAATVKDDLKVDNNIWGDGGESSEITNNNIQGNCPSGMYVRGLVISGDWKFILKCSKL